MSRMVGSYETETDAIRAIEDLQSQGYHSDEISVLSKDKDETRHITEETGTHAGEGAATGALTGGALGGLGGVLAGIGALAIPGIGPIVAAGPIVAGLTGAAAGAGVGGLAGALIGAGIPEDDAKEYESQFKDGRILVMVDDEKSPIADSVERDRFIEGNRDSTLGNDQPVFENGGDAHHERSSLRNDGESLIGGEDSSTIRGDRDPLFDDQNDPSKRGPAGL